MPRRNHSRIQPIAPLGNRPPERRIGNTLEGPVVEQYPATAYHRKMVSPTGSVVFVPLATGRTIGNVSENIYGREQWEEKIEKGWLPYSECPIARGYVKAGADDRPCDGIDPKRPGIFYRHPTDARGRENASVFVEEQCCEHVEKAISLRQATHKAKSQRYAAENMNSNEKMVEVMKAMLARETNMSRAEQDQVVNPAALGRAVEPNVIPEAAEGE